MGKIKQGQDVELYTNEPVELGDGKKPLKIVNLGEEADEEWMDNLIVEKGKTKGENKSKIKPKE